MNSNWSQQNKKELTDQKIRKLHLSRIFRYGNSQVYHFANNNVVAQNETVKTLNCFLTWEEKLRFVTFCMMTFFWGSIGENWLRHCFNELFFSFSADFLNENEALTLPPPPSIVVPLFELGKRHQLKERAGCSLHCYSPKYPH